VSHPDTPREPLTDAYLAQCEMDARQFQGAYTGTSGTLAAHVMRLLGEVRRLKVASAYAENVSRAGG
jgi:hypothetical protein